MIPKYFIAPKEPVKVYPDGREVCDLKTAAGKREYDRRLREMVDRQRFRCCLEGIAPMCPGPLRYEAATFEHEASRGMSGSKRDDRIWVDGQPLNGAAHMACNSWKGSRRIKYN